ncbi:MAG TPA: hypothetical protein VHR45_00385 [Thermoanaerobaculia bacterium]|nr:hypothetical protein [Thermoanaerobaculia bacterium]
MTVLTAPAGDRASGAGVLLALSLALAAAPPWCATAFAAALGEPPSAPAAGRYQVTVHGDQPLFSQTPEVLIEGTTDAPVGATVEVTLVRDLPGAPATPPGAAAGALAPQTTTVREGGRFSLAWPAPLAAGSYEVRVMVTFSAAGGGGGGSGSASQPLVIQLPGRFPRRPLLAVPEVYAPPAVPAAGDFQEFTDRWRVVLPPYELNVKGRPLDPYHQNRWKGDLPIHGQDLFLDLTAVSDTLLEARTLPTPSGASARRPGSIHFFGDRGQLFATETLAVSADLFRGDTAFRPIDWRVKASVVGNANYLQVAENGIVNPDVRNGTRRTNGWMTLQELFGERKLADLSASYDFVSLRAGIQPFASDFRGFIFTDTNLGARLFGNYQANRDQFNLAFFERLEKDTNSGLNTFKWRRQTVAIANFYRQDFLVPGYTVEPSLVYFHDQASFEFDKNGFLARPDPVGSAMPHAVHALYAGWAGLGHFGRWNVDHAFYFAAGSDSLNPIAGPDPRGGSRDRVDVRAGMAALEVSIDRDWWRPKLAIFYASGDGHPTGRTARGFDAIFDEPAFAGGGFSFWNRMGIKLAGAGVALVNRGSLLPDLRSSKEEGQPNFVNPGLQLASAAVDLDLTPQLRAVATANFLRFDRTEVLELLLFQSPIRKTIGWDLSLGMRYRPLLNNNIALLAGVAALLPGAGFKDIYEGHGALFALFTDLTLTF